MRRGSTYLFFALAAASIVAPLAAAHAAPLPREFEKRFLHDCIDDYYGGHLGAEKDGHDLISLDVREVYDEGLGADALIVRLIMNGGYRDGSTKPVLKDEFTFQAAGATKVLRFTTTDNTAFTGTFDRVTGPTAIGDGERFALEGASRLTTLGFTIGTVLASFNVEGFYGSSRGDVMPGTYDSGTGSLVPREVGCTGTGDPTGNDGGDTRLPDYTVRGPSFYVSTAFDTPSVSVSPGADLLVTVNVVHLLRTTQEAVTFKVTGGPGFDVAIHDIASNTYVAEYRQDLPGKDEMQLHVRVHGVDPGATGTVTLNATTQYGGRSLSTLAVTVGAAGTTTNPQATDGPSPKGKSPDVGVASATVLVGLAAFCLRGRRRP